MSLKRLIYFGLIVITGCLISEQPNDNECGGEGGSFPPKLFNADTSVLSPVLVGKIIENNQFSPGTMVRLESLNSPNALESNEDATLDVCTNQNGEYLFSGLEKGEYTISIKKSSLSKTVALNADSVFELNANVSTGAPELHIDITDPKHYAQLDTSMLKLSAKYTGNLMHLNMYPILSDMQHGNYFIQYPTAFVDEKTQTLLHENIRPGTVGKWVLYLCTFDEDAHQLAQARLEEGDFSGMQDLPEGAYCLDYVIFDRIN